MTSADEVLTNLRDRSAFLANVPVFRNLATETLQAVARRMRQREFDDGDFGFSPVRRLMRSTYWLMVTLR